MKPLPAEFVDAERAVAAFKHALLLRVMGFIVREALARGLVCPGDVPEDIVEDHHRQGVVSNAWNSVCSLGIVERLPMNLNVPALGIFGGRIKNRNGRAKGRWTAAYRLASEQMARTWAEANGVALGQEAPAPAQMPLLAEFGEIPA